jgi:hypothetical protein
MVEDVAINALNFNSIQRPRAEYFRLERMMLNSTDSEIDSKVQYLLLNNQNYCANVGVLLCDCIVFDFIFD